MSKTEEVIRKLEKFVRDYHDEELENDDLVDRIPARAVQEAIDLLKLFQDPA